MNRRTGQKGRRYVLSLLLLALTACAPSALPKPPSSRARAAARAEGVRDIQARAALVVDLYSRGRYQEAEQEAEPLLQVLRREGSTRDIVFILGMLGQIELKLGRPGKAVEDLNEALRLGRAIGAASDVSALLHNLGFAYEQSGRYQEALPLLQESLRRVRSQGDARAEASNLHTLGNVYQNLDEPEKALEHFQRAEALFQSLRAENDLWMSRLSIAQMYAHQGRYPEALALGEEAIRRLRQLKDLDMLASALDTVADLERDQGRSEEARQRIEESLAIRRGRGDLDGEAADLNRLCDLESARGRLEPALDDAERALALHRQAGNRKGEAISLLKTAQIYSQIGRHEEALARYEQALELAHAMGDPAGVVSSLRCLASLLLKAPPEAALARIEEALPVAAANDRRMEMTLLLGKGTMLHLLGRQQEALRPLSRVLQLSREFGDACVESTALYQMGAVQAASFQLEEVRKLLDQALQVAQKGGCAQQTRMTQSGLGELYEKLNQKSLAIAAYRAAIDAFEATLEEVHTDDFTAGLMGEATAPYSKLIRLLVDAGDSAEAFAVAERARGRAFLRQMGSRQIDLRRGADSAVIAEEQELKRRLDLWRRRVEDERRKPIEQQRRALLAELAGEIDRGRRHYETLLLRLKATNPEYASLLRPAPLTLSAVRDQLDGEATLIEYFVLDEQTTLAWVIERGSFQLVRLPIASHLIDQWIRELRDRISLRRPTDGSYWTLHYFLFAPLIPFIHHTNLWIVPHGFLHLLPFAALVGEHWRPLVESYAIAYLPSASVLPLVLAKRKPSGGRLLALGDPDGSLPHAAAELRAVAKLYGAEPLLGSRATESAWRAGAPQAELLHLATHVVFDRSRPLFSRIALARDAENDGNLEVHEVFGLDLHRASLVALSGCESGLDQIDDGDEQVGFTRAFLYAGAPSVLATLWPIDDEASAALMQSFYRHLRAGDTPAGALRAAQLEIRKDPHWKSPYYWAAFRLTGDGLVALASSF